MSADRPSPAALADDIRTNSASLIDNSQNTQAHNALLKDAGYLGGTAAGDQQYRTQVQEALTQSGTPRVEDRNGAGLGISIYSGGGASEIEAVKALPGQHAEFSANHGESIRAVPNYREALASGPVNGFEAALGLDRGQMTIWENGKDVTNSAKK